MPGEHASKLKGFQNVFNTPHVPDDEGIFDQVAKDLTAGTIGCPPEGLRYRELPVEQRIIVMQMAHLRRIDESLDSIDSSLRHAGEWFRTSKPYWP